MMHETRKTFKGRLAAVVAVVFFGVALTAQAQDSSAQNWKTYSYPADGFSASYPSEPELQKRDVPTDAGSFQLRSYSAQVAPVALFIGVCDSGTQVVGSDPDTLLEGAKKGALSNFNSHLLSEKKITLGTYPGVEFEAESDAAHFTARIYMVGTTLYQTLAVAALGKPYADAPRFLDSFQLIARVPN
jgi:hypothetical protein